MDNRVWVKDAVMTIRLPEEVDHFVADRLREEAGEILVERNVNFMVVICIYQNAVRILKCRKCGHFVSDRAAHCLYLFICVQLSFCENLLSNVFF